MTGVIRRGGLTVSYDSANSMLIQADEVFREGLRQLQEGDAFFDSNQTMVDVFDNLLSNSELVWLAPEDTGDLTDAPLLGILGDVCRQEDLPPDRYGEVFAGYWDGAPRYQPVLARWGWMPYAVTSLQEQLLREGWALLRSEA